MDRKDGEKHFGYKNSVKACKKSKPIKLMQKALALYIIRGFWKILYKKMILIINRVFAYLVD